MAVNEGKRCVRCGAIKPLLEFHKHNQLKDGRRPDCKICRNKVLKKYREENGEKEAQRARAWYKDNTERAKENQRRYYVENRTATLERTRDWYRNNKAQYRAKKKEWRRNNKDKAAVYARNRRAKQADVAGVHSDEDIQKIRTGQRNKCWWCCQPLNGTHHIDHRIPVSRGGTNDISNLVVSCPPCNLRKHTKTPAEFAGMLF